MINKRLESLDIAKGLLIILVVLGHSTFEFTDIIYWFHMPAFFIISGLLYKEKTLKLIKLFTSLFIPFLVYIILNVFIRCITNPNFEGINDVTMLLERHLYNGKVIGGVFWYIPVFFMTKVMFDSLYKVFEKQIWVIMFICYGAAHLISIYLIPDLNNYFNTSKTLVLPWDLDVVLMAVWYYYIGFLIKNFVSKIDYKIAMFTFILCIGFILANGIFDINYHLDMKYSYYKALILDTFIPLLFTIFTLALSSLILKSKLNNLFSYIGKKSMYIMFLHIPICASILEINNYIIFTIVGVVIPLGIAFVIEQNRYTTYIFTGKQPSM
ncbi:acyltransferase family protein [Bacillus sp. CH30_1T]|uniref:acyltransferase family protein n=1 Tax=Bacillus sp. CH30_1T TaxID=2604836 RepID=UPI0011F008B9|nr:acyltransferase family protein [Bacillus sp. CH30_1T]KAA0563678.1 acyltransferase family protein [Bacillus sp. CH30_1T]